MAGKQVRSSLLYFKWMGLCLPNEEESEAHEALSLLFQREGVPKTMVVDGALKQVQFPHVMMEYCRVRNT